MKVLSAQPIVTKGFTSFSVYLLGDWTAQVSRRPFHLTYASLHMPYAFLPNTRHTVLQSLYLLLHATLFGPLLPSPGLLLTRLLPCSSHRSMRASRWRRLTAGGWRAQPSPG